jgi:hypothetical protein
LLFAGVEISHMGCDPLANVNGLANIATPVGPVHYGVDAGGLWEFFDAI